jgi:hypothetical protein
MSAQHRSHFARAVAVLNAIFAANCGSVVSPTTEAGTDGGAVDTSIREDVSAPVDSSDSSTSDASRNRNESIVVVEVNANGSVAMAARLLRAEAVLPSNDRVVEGCRFYNRSALPETSAGTLTLRRGSESTVIVPIAGGARDLYIGRMQPPTADGVRFSVQAEGSATFPAFELSETLPRSLVITSPSQPQTLEFNPDRAIRFEWTPDSSGDIVLVHISGDRSEFGPSWFMRCMTPIASESFVVKPEMLREFTSLPRFRLISVLRSRVTRASFGDAQITLTVSNTSTNTWVEFR